MYVDKKLHEEDFISARFFYIIEKKSQNDYQFK